MRNSLGGAMVRPNVSHCVQENEVHYNPLIIPIVIATYNVADTSQPMLLYSEPKNNPYFTKVTVDGTEVELLSGEVGDYIQYGYHFATTGEHTVEYTLNDPTAIGERVFKECEALTSVIIPDGVITIGDRAFQRSAVANVMLPDSVTSIGRYSFERCSNLASINIPSGLVSVGYGAFGPPSNPLYENETLRNIILGFNEYAFKWEK